MRAILLAGGLGTRLRPLTNQIPKIMLPLNGKPMLQYDLELLRKYGIVEIAINLHHLPEKIKDYFGNGEKFGVKIKYLYEKRLSGTAGAVKKLIDFIKTDFMVFYGDNLTNMNLGNLIAYHQKKRGLVTLAFYPTKEPWNKGIVEMNHNHQIIKFIEKPKLSETDSCWSNSGIYIMKKRILKYIPKIKEGDIVDFGFDIFPKILQSGEKIFGFYFKGYILDIGAHKTYRQAQKDMAKGVLL